MAKPGREEPDTPSIRYPREWQSSAFLTRKSLPSSRIFSNPTSPPTTNEAPTCSFIKYNNSLSSILVLSSFFPCLDFNVTAIQPEPKPPSGTIFRRSRNEEQSKGWDTHGQRKKRRSYGNPECMASRCCPCFAVSSIARRIGRCLFVSCYPVMHCFRLDDHRHQHDHHKHFHSF